MNLSQIKSQIVEAGFSEYALKKLNDILEMAETNGGLTDEQRKNAVSLIEGEQKRVELEAQIMSDIAITLDESLDKVRDVQKNVDDHLLHIEDNMVEELDEEISKGSVKAPAN